jgi:hypothetical protein
MANLRKGSKPDFHGAMVRCLLPLLCLSSLVPTVFSIVISLSTSPFPLPASSHLFLRHSATLLIELRDEQDLLRRVLDRYEGEVQGGQDLRWSVRPLFPLPPSSPAHPLLSCHSFGAMMDVQLVNDVCTALLRAFFLFLTFSTLLHPLTFSSQHLLCLPLHSTGSRHPHPRFDNRRSRPTSPESFCDARAKSKSEGEGGSTSGRTEAWKGAVGGGEGGID